jgi:hypothetical protein
VPFPKDAVVVVKQIDDQNWELREMLRYRVLPRLELNIAGRAPKVTAPASGGPEPA